MTEQDVPKFDSFEEMQAWLDKQTTGKFGSEEISSSPSAVSKKKSVRKKTSKRSLPKKDEGVALEGNKIRKEIWSSVHFYTQEGDSIQKVRRDAKEERQYRNENVVVYFHDHFFGEACKNTCGKVDA